MALRLRRPLALVVVLLVVGLGGVLASEIYHQRAPRPVGSARLSARPHPPTQPTPVGLTRLPRFDGSGGRDGVLYVPAALSTPAHLVVAFHGATGRGERMLDKHLRGEADRRGFAVLAPDARGETWDVVRDDRFGPDITYLDRALAWTFDRLDVDPRSIVVTGFSDGASYALSLGLANGELFSRIVAYSPGGVAEVTGVGQPRVFVSHGRSDDVLPLATCGQVIVDDLRGDGYDVSFQVFDGGHHLPAEIVQQSFEWIGWSERSR